MIRLFYHRLHFTERLQYNSPVMRSPEYHCLTNDKCERQHCDNIDQKKYIRYTEVDEEGHETKNRLVIDASEIHLKKSGQNVFDMRFAKEVESAGIYETPYGSFATVITTTEIVWEETDTEIQVALDYSLEMQNAHVADCHMDIRICES